jgi:hypothetical protein
MDINLNLVSHKKAHEAQSQFSNGKLDMTWGTFKYEPRASPTSPSSLSLSFVLYVPFCGYVLLKSNCACVGLP